MEITSLYIYKIIFTCEILIAFFLFTSQMPKRKYCVARYIAVSTVAILASTFYPLLQDVSYTWWYSSLMFLLLFILCFIGTFFIIKISFQKLFIIGVAAYTAQHLSYQIYSLLCFVFHFDETLQTLYSSDIIDVTFSIILVWRIVITVIVYALVYVGIFNIFISKIKDETEISNFSIAIVSALILLIDIVANSIVVYNDDNHNLVTSIIICAYNILSCLMVFFILYFIINIRSLRYELLVKSMLLNQAEEKYEQSKANYESINIKVHDLKHQIRQFGSQKTLQKETIDEIENMIQIYDSTMHTNNKAIDIILVEKKMLCNQLKVDLKVYADCSRLNYISDVDLYSLFGNAIDNAIEAVSKVSDPKKKTINLIVKNVGDFISIVIENYFVGNILFGENRMPITTKTINKENHGYGLKSIQSIVDKYAGALNIDFKNDVFKLSILFKANNDSSSD